MNIALELQTIIEKKLFDILVVKAMQISTMDESK